MKMKRRKFIRNASLAAAGAIAAPYILPAGRLFAQTGSQLAGHVVFVMFAGGVRQQESVLQRYLADSQGLSNIEGNIMLNMLNGQQPQAKIAYGTDPAGQPEGSQPIPKVLSGNNTIESLGTFFPEVQSTTAGHFSGLNTLLTGNTAVTQGLKQKPVFPTIFEYARRHLGLPATKTWFVGNGIGNSIPLLNYSTHDAYGVDYGGNFLAPNITFGSGGEKHLSKSKIYHPEEELDPMYQMKYFLDNTFSAKGRKLINGIANTEEERQDVKEFIRQMFIKKKNGSIDFPPVNDNGDMSNVGYALEVMKWFKPAITVINMSSVDGCHSNFTGYLRSLHRADHAVGHIWNTIQNTPGMANDTIMVVMPEHGRNDDPNPILDENDWYAYDHSDANSRRMFAQMIGPNVPAGLTIGSEANQTGTAMDAVPTIAEILGFKGDLQSAGYLSGNAKSLFDRI